jgi:hypothetical protein
VELSAARAQLADCHQTTGNQDGTIEMLKDVLEEAHLSKETEDLIREIT